MKAIIRFVIDLAIPFVLVALGAKLVTWGADKDSGILFWTGIVLVVVGLIRGLWMMLSNGVSPWGD